MFLKSNVHSMESASIIYKINNEIISNIDIEDEIRYLIALNNQLETVDNETIFKIAAQSLIKEKIKKNELLNYYLLDQKNPNLDNIIKDYYLKLGLNSDVNFEEYLKRYELKIEDIRKKIEIEATWNELIYTKYNSFLQIDEQKLRLKLKNQKPNNEK